MKRAIALVVIVAGIAAWGVWRRSATRPAVAPVEEGSRQTPSGPKPVTTTRPLAPRRVPPVPRALENSTLQTASRDELLAYARDLLARGGPLEDIVALLEYFAATKPEFAVDLARDIGRTDAERQVLLYATLTAWARDDASAALRWAFAKADAYNIPGNASLLYLVLEQVAGDAPETAIAVAENALATKSDSDSSTDQGRVDVARLTLEALIKNGHADTARQAFERWANGPNAANLQGSDYEVMAMAIAQQSFAEAGTWLQSLGRAPARNQAYANFAAAWIASDAPAAMNWAQTLDPADGGDDVRVATFALWVKSDRAGAEQWLSANSRPDPTRERLRSLLDAPPARASSE